MAWLTAFLGVHVKNYNEAYGIVPEMVWKLYKLHGTRNVWEIDNLRTYKRIMWDRWDARPMILRKVSHGKNGKTSNPKSAVKSRKS